MSISSLMDEIREKVISDDTLSPSRLILYTRKLDGVFVEINALVTPLEHNEEAAETLQNKMLFRALKLEFAPKPYDTITFDGEVYSVDQNFSKLGNLYSVTGEQKRHRGRSR